jgi:hypothetical protein
MPVFAGVAGVKTGDVVTDIIDNERFAEKIGS